MKHTQQELKELQALPLYRKIGITQSRIAEWYNYWSGNVYVSFSGGKDSTVLLHIARQMYPDIPAVFCNTGLEYPEIYKFVKKFNNIVIIKPDIHFKEVIEKYGYPVISKEVSQKIEGANRGQKSAINALVGKNLDGSRNKFKERIMKWKYLQNAPFKISNRCCDILKKKPFVNYEKQSKRSKIVGTICEESFLRKNAWIKNGCNLFENNPRSAPLSIWTNQDILQYIKLNKIEIANIYGEVVEFNGKLILTRVNRTGCMFCAFGAHLDKPNKFQSMAITHPTQLKYCLDKLGFRAVLEYLQIPYEPTNEQLFEKMLEI